MAQRLYDFDPWARGANNIAKALFPDPRMKAEGEVRRAQTQNYLANADRDTAEAEKTRTETAGLKGDQNALREMDAAILAHDGSEPSLARIIAKFGRVAATRPDLVMDAWNKGRLPGLAKGSDDQRMSALILQGKAPNLTDVVSPGNQAAVLDQQAKSDLAQAQARTAGRGTVSLTGPGGGRVSVTAPQGEVGGLAQTIAGQFGIDPQAKPEPQWIEKNGQWFLVVPQGLAAHKAGSKPMGSVKRDIDGNTYEFPIDPAEAEAQVRRATGKAAPAVEPTTEPPSANQAWLNSLPGIVAGTVQAQPEFVPPPEMIPGVPAVPAPNAAPAPGAAASMGGLMADAFFRDQGAQQPAPTYPPATNGTPAVIGPAITEGPPPTAPQAPGGAPPPAISQPQAPAPGSRGPLTQDLARLYVQRARGDKQLARQLALNDGYSLPPVP